MAEKKITCSLCGEKYSESDIEYVERDGDKPRPYCSGDGTKHCFDITDAQDLTHACMEVRAIIDNNYCGWRERYATRAIVMMFLSNDRMTPDELRTALRELPTP